MFFWTGRTGIKFIENFEERCFVYFNIEENNEENAE